jgi:Ca2+:H+ antiporter
MGRSGFTKFVDRIRSGAGTQATGRQTPLDNSLQLPISEPRGRSDGNINERVTEKIGGLKNAPVDSKSTNFQPSPRNESNSSSPNSQAIVSSGSSSMNHHQTNKPPKAPISTRIKNGTKRFWLHTKNALFRSSINILLVFVPIGIASNFAHLKPEIIFAMNAIAIIPLAGLLTHATESVAVRLGDTLGALLNVSFGNAVELIIFIIALIKNEIRIVQASLLGSILANLLLIMGMAFACGGLLYQEQIYNSTVTQMSACLLSLSVMSLLLPVRLTQRNSSNYLLTMSLDCVSCFFPRYRQRKYPNFKD